MAERRFRLIKGGKPTGYEKSVTAEQACEECDYAELYFFGHLPKDTLVWMHSYDGEKWFPPTWCNGVKIVYGDKKELGIQVGDEWWYENDLFLSYGKTMRLEQYGKWWRIVNVDDDSDKVYARNWVEYEMKRIGSIYDKE